MSPTAVSAPCDSTIDGSTSPRQDGDGHRRSALRLATPARRADDGPAAGWLRRLLPAGVRWAARTCLRVEPPTEEATRSRRDWEHYSAVLGLPGAVGRAIRLPTVQTSLLGLGGDSGSKVLEAPWGR